MTHHSPRPSMRLASLPVYQAHTVRHDAIHHLLVCAGAPDPSDLHLLAALQQHAPQRHQMRVLEDDSSDGDCAASACLRAQFEPLLADARTGWHLYLSGPETGLWPLYAWAIQSGMQPSEISLHCHGSDTRPIYCVHCGIRQQAATTASHPTCAHCGVVLEVRDHFSRVQGAYLGVVADADTPYAR